MYIEREKERWIDIENTRGIVLELLEAFLFPQGINLLRALHPDRTLGTVMDFPVPSFPVTSKSFNGLV